MKLSKQEVSALASTIIRDTRKAAQKEKTEFFKTAKVAQQVDDILATIKKFPKPIQDKCLRWNSREDFIEALSGGFKPKVNVPSESELKDEIIIACIDSETMEDLKNKLKSFIKEA